ncbi:MAG: hypothetical protein K8F91_16290 [Candidatus Obscuribacterales bacterium]|nr:hypothetical protein [Candidatus Obscuribacterales bacterium]
MATNGKSTEDRARALISDPKASEREWLNACAVMDKPGGGSLQNWNLPKWVGLPWSILISATGATGGLILFAMLTNMAYSTFQFFLPNLYAEAMITYLIAALAMPVIVFNTLFTYQKHLWQGGKIWTGIQATIVVAAAFSPLLIGTIITGSLIPIAETLTMGGIGIGLCVTSILATFMAQRCMKNLDSTIGARRIVPYSRAAFCAPAILYGALSLTGLSGAVLAYNGLLWLLSGAILGGSAFLIATANRSFNANTSLQLAFTTWNPFIITIALMVPILLVNSLLAIGFGSYFAVSIVDILSTSFLASLALGFPAAGALIATRRLRNQQELELHQVPNLKSSVSASGGKLPQLNKETA